MNLAAIVCEYNPFHLGHKLHIEETRRITGCDGVIGVMSGNFVQRGEPALFSKRVRADAAVHCGADLILELSPYFAVRSAEQFALNALKIVTSIPEVKYLSFGIEANELSSLKKAAEILAEEPEEYKKALKEELDSGVSYPRARQLAMEASGGKEAAEALSSPNNILGVEYLKALMKLGSKIEPAIVKRIGAAHDSLEPGEYVSASYLRRAFYDDEMLKFKKGIPKEAFSEYTTKPFMPCYALEKLILSRIITMTNEELSEISEVSEGLENRIKKAVFLADTLEELAEEVKTKRYTMSKIKRILLCAGLGIKKNEKYSLPPYAKILAFNENGQKILNTIKKTSEIPIVKNMTALKSLGDIELIRQYIKEAELDRLYGLFQNPHMP